MPAEIVPETHVDKKELKCLAANIHFEARGEPHAGKIAVGHVTVNRKNDPRFPKNICDVVKQPGQFAWYQKGTKLEQLKIPAATIQLAYEILSGKYIDLSKGAHFFHNHTVGAFNRKVTTKIGNHTFYA